MNRECYFVLGFFVILECDNWLYVGVLTHTVSIACGRHSGDFWFCCDLNHGWEFASNSNLSFFRFRFIAYVLDLDLGCVLGFVNDSNFDPYCAWFVQAFVHNSDKMFLWFESCSWFRIQAYFCITITNHDGHKKALDGETSLNFQTICPRKKYWNPIIRKKCILQKYFTKKLHLSTDVLSKIWKSHQNIFLEQTTSLNVCGLGQKTFSVVSVLFLALLTTTRIERIVLVKMFVVELLMDNCTSAFVLKTQTTKCLWTCRFVCPCELRVKEIALCRCRLC